VGGFVAVFHDDFAISSLGDNVFVVTVDSYTIIEDGVTCVDVLDGTLDVGIHRRRALFLCCWTSGWPRGRRRCFSAFFLLTISVSCSGIAALICWVLGIYFNNNRHAAATVDGLFLALGNTLVRADHGVVHRHVASGN